MLRSKKEKSTDLINQFIIAEHKELRGTTYKYDTLTLGNWLFGQWLYTIINKLNNIKNDKK